MHFSDSSKSNDTTESSEASTSMSRFMSYWQYYHRKNSPFLESFSHVWSQGFTFHPSSNHHHYHHIIITTSLLSSNHYHLTITSSSPVSKDHISHYISRKTLHQLEGSQATERKRKKVFDYETKSICDTLHSCIITRSRGLVGHCGHCVHAGNCVHAGHCVHSGHCVHLALCPFCLKLVWSYILEKRCTSWPLRKSTRRGWLQGR